MGAMRSGIAGDTSQLVFAFLEDGSLQIFGNNTSAQQEFEGVDVESETVLFFDCNGRRLAPRFSSPNQQGAIFKIFRWVSSGIYELVPDLHATGDSVALSLHECKVLEPNPWFQTLEEVSAHFQGRGINLDQLQTA
jgi:hypothetical protein